MPITHHPDGCTVITGEGIALFRLMTLARGLRIEKLGMRVTRGVKCSTIVRREFGFKGNHDKLIEQLDAYIAAVKASVAHVDGGHK